MKKIFLNTVLIFFTVLSIAQTTKVDKTEVQSFIVGGVSIKIPIPDNTFVEVGNGNRESMEVFAPQNNRLLGAYVLTSDLPQLFKGNNSDLMAKYALLEVPRKAEKMDCDVSFFKQVTDGAKKSFGNADFLFTQETEDEINRIIKSLDLTDNQIKLGQPTPLGCFFSKQDMIGFGMLIRAKMSGSTIMKGSTIIMMRVKKRLLLFYLIADYENFETIKWLRIEGEKWGDEILEANKL